MKVSILVPVGWHGNAEMQQARGKAWAFVRAWYQNQHPDWELVEGRQTREQRQAGWVKGQAFNDAASRATGDVFVLADADVFIDAAILNHATRVAVEDGKWCVPYKLVYRLSEHATELVYRGTPPRRGDLITAPYEGSAGGGLAVVTREMWDAVGGFDTGFVGWGKEDHAFGCALHAMVSWHERLDGLLWHLWHPMGGSTNRRPSPANNELHHRYKKARQNPPAMAALIAERRASGHLAPAHLDLHRDAQDVRSDA